MKIVVDTNILFSFFWSDSLTRKLLMTSDFELISPEITLEEIKKHSDELCKRLRMKNKTFIEHFNKLKEVIQFIPKKEYSGFLKESEEISPDKNDAEFFALCLKYSCILWSNDLALKNKNKINVLSTEDIIEIMF